MENIGDSLTITVIGMGVIFVVLVSLMGTIVALNKIFPYVVAPAVGADGKGSIADDTEVVAVIQAAITAYRRRKG